MKIAGLNYDLNSLNSLLNYVNRENILVTIMILMF